MKTKIFKTSYLFAFAMALLLGSYATVSRAQNSITWDKLGTQVVDFTLDRDVVTVSSQQSYNALKIKVNNGMVNIHKVTVHFANGETQDIKLPKELTKNNDGKLIDLKGNQRIIKKITFWYDTENANKDKAVVEVWARK